MPSRGHCRSMRGPLKRSPGRARILACPTSDTHSPAVMRCGFLKHTPDLTSRITNACAPGPRAKMPSYSCANPKLEKAGVARPLIVPKYSDVGLDIITNLIRTAGVTREAFLALLANCWGSYVEDRILRRHR